METCKHGSGAGSRKPTAEMRQGAECRAYYVLILDYCCGALNIIELTEKEINESYNYEDFESFLETLEDKYGFRLKDCNWMTTESLSIYRYKDGKEVANV